ncbi:hypothetical protein P3X46_030364 [Hevea brasiliensis]|uniref:glucan endo-1,3-beta-D-glucosidase n=1 Tax=Hevea brasiliensis TaxID=3981 RepID=A0ABQ9KJZ3_HEVBR|nr:hypothetical protein P3X46_030364 [Hevea brasiliensis]
MAPILLLLALLISSLGITEAQSTGVCYGKNGNNLPSEQEVVSLCETNGIGRMRIYNPDQQTLHAIRGSSTELILAYASDVKFRHIAVGNEVHPGDANAKYVLPAMQNVHNAIVAANLQDQIKVSTAIDTTLLGISYPPSNDSFTPLLANIYPYFSYTNDPQSISLEYALFTEAGIVVTDGQYGYQNLFDALLDSLYSALEKAGSPNLQIVVSESGWPSEGGDVATVNNAGTYYRNLINHVKQGTPKKSGQAVETFLFSMFDENLKEAEIEQHFGLFLPNKQPKYQITFG